MTDPSPHELTQIFLSPPDVGPTERELLLDAFDSNWIAPLGPHVDGFEADILAWSDTAHAVALSSGTAVACGVLIFRAIKPARISSILSGFSIVLSFRCVRGDSAPFSDSKILGASVAALAPVGRLPQRPGYALGLAV